MTPPDSIEPRPWTPGPWRVEHVEGVDGDDWYWIESECGDTPIYGGNDHEHSPRIAANLDLTALAPELAEAVLALTGFYEDDAGDEDAAWAALYALAQRLRAIGGGDA